MFIGCSFWEHCSTVAGCGIHPCLLLHTGENAPQYGVHARALLHTMGRVEQGSVSVLRRCGFQLRTRVEHREDVDAIVERPGHHVAEVGGGLAVEFALEPGGVLAELFGQVSDGRPSGSQFLKHCPGGAVLEDRPCRLGRSQRARICPDGPAGACKIPGVRAHSRRFETRFPHTSMMT